MTYEELREEIQSANLVLVGIGEELLGELTQFCQDLANLLGHKDYFIVSLSASREGLEAVGLNPERITLPLAEEEPKESWERYLHWLSFTLNQKLCILELGVGFTHPTIIRFPFEKTCYFNQKARLIRVNEQFSQLPPELAERGVSVAEAPIVFLAGKREDRT